mmetsp:Transcript_6002/g.19349  ORF Transcript_6002/g.19349 Transcript_6002/m.19349 type:complete len:347 (-) Transcript_6002:414-1454(-)
MVQLTRHPAHHLDLIAKQDRVLLGADALLLVHRLDRVLVLGDGRDRCEDFTEATTANALAKPVMIVHRAHARQGRGHLDAPNEADGLLNDMDPLLPVFLAVRSQTPNLVLCGGRRPGAAVHTAARTAATAEPAREEAASTTAVGRGERSAARTARERLALAWTSPVVARRSAKALRGGCVWDHVEQELPSLAGIAWDSSHHRVWGQLEPAARVGRSALAARLLLVVLEHAPRDLHVAADPQLAIAKATLDEPARLSQLPDLALGLAEGQPRVKNAAVGRFERAKVGARWARPHIQLQVEIACECAVVRRGWLVERACVRPREVLVPPGVLTISEGASWAINPGPSV